MCFKYKTRRLLLIFYVFIMLFCVLVLVINNKITKPNDKRKLDIITLIGLCIISGTRYYLGGTDYNIYKLFYDNLPSLQTLLHYYDTAWIQSLTRGYEIGYVVVNSFFHTIGLNFYGYTLVESAFFYFCFYKGLRKYVDSFSLLIFVFLYKLFFYDTFISMRQSITIAIFFLAMHYIQERKCVKYYVVCLFALFFHNAALILLILYPLFFLKLTKKKLLLANCIFIPTLLISALNIPVLKIFDFMINFFRVDGQIEKANLLFNGVSLNGLSAFHTIEFFLIMLLVYINYDKIIKCNINAEFILKIFLCLLPIMTLFRNYEILTRIKDYFIISYGIILNYLCMIDNKRFCTIVQICTVLVCCYGFYRFIFLFDGGSLMPYVSYLTQNISIFN